MRGLLTLAGYFQALNFKKVFKYQLKTEYKMPKQMPELFHGSQKSNIKSIAIKYYLCCNTYNKLIIIQEL